MSPILSDMSTQSSRDWVSEEEGSTFGSRKRKISGGDIIGSSSPLISESAPNSPASTHYGFVAKTLRCLKIWGILECAKHANHILVAGPKNTVPLDVG